MSIEVDDLIEKKIEKKLGLYEPRNSGRRTANEIRDRLQFELDKRPKTTKELQNAINAKKPTVENHCEHLKELEVVEQIEVEGTKYWRLIQ